MFLEQSFPHPVRHVRAAPLWVFGLVFVLGVAAGTLIPARGGFSIKAAVVPTAPPVSPPASSSALWPRTGNLSVRHPVEVVRVIDGDTFEAQVHLWPGLDMTTRVRLRGIDAPELKAACADELKMAQDASEALRVLLTEGDVAIFNIGPDKYNGRVVADISTRQTPNISLALLSAGHARPYQGGKRSGWCAVTSRQ